MGSLPRYDVELYQRIEELLEAKLELHPCEEGEVMQFLERVTEAQRNAMTELKTMTTKKKEYSSDGKSGGKRSGGGRIGQGGSKKKSRH